jgi:nucleotide-binding universal stress UspA family protein
VHAYQDVALSVAAMADGVGGAGYNVAAVNADIEALGKQVLDAAAADAAAAGVTVETHLMRGDPADVLLRVAADVSADLVVVGNRGMSGVKRFMLGSVPNRVSHHCTTNLLIVDTTH